LSPFFIRPPLAPHPVANEDVVLSFKARAGSGDVAVPNANRGGGGTKVASTSTSTGLSLSRNNSNNSNPSSIPTSLTSSPSTSGVSNVPLSNSNDATTVSLRESQKTSSFGRSKSERRLAKAEKREREKQEREKERGERETAQSLHQLAPHVQFDANEGGRERGEPVAAHVLEMEGNAIIRASSPLVAVSPHVMTKSNAPPRTTTPLPALDMSHSNPNPSNNNAPSLSSNSSQHSPNINSSPANNTNISHLATPQTGVTATRAEKPEGKNGTNETFSLLLVWLFFGLIWFFCYGLLFLLFRSVSVAC
jgi:hypothetical protein